MHLDGWTLVFPAINLVVLLALLRWLFYGPLLAVIDARRAAIDAELANAHAARLKAQEEAKSLSDERAALATSRETLLRAAQADADRERAAAREEAARAGEAALLEGRRQVERARRDAAHALQVEASDLATALAERLLALAQSSDGDNTFLQTLMDRLRAVAPAERASWFQADAPRALVLACAHALGTAQQASARDSLFEVFGTDLQITFEVDARLIQGAELRMPHGVLALHWAAELARARAQMQVEPGSAPS